MMRPAAGRGAATVSSEEELSREEELREVTSTE
jgi:hypothetical protein